MNSKGATSDSSAVRSSPGEPKGLGDTDGAQPDGVAAASEPKSKKQSGAKASGKASGARAPGDVGQLLRGAYRQTVDEAIPDDLMDLLSKLE